MATAQTRWQTESIQQGQTLYAEYCVDCHASDGRGILDYPDLTVESVRSSGHAALYAIIARGLPNTDMAAWGIEAGGSLQVWQINALVMMLQVGDWTETSRLVQARLTVTPQLPTPQTAAPLPAAIIPTPEPLPSTLTPTPEPQVVEQNSRIDAFYNGGCVGCHIIANVPGATGRTGPDLSKPAKPGLTLKAYLPQHLVSMGYVIGTAPNITRQISPAELDQIVEHLSEPVKVE
jgi:mono/diheme cytochrome c family protein